MHLNPCIVEEIEQPDDASVAAQKRAVEVNGKIEQFPHPNTFSGWDKDLRTLPPLTSAYCLVYLVAKKGWSPERISKYEKECGYSLFREGHIFGGQWTQDSGKTKRAGEFLLRLAVLGPAGLTPKRRKEKSFIWLKACTCCLLRIFFLKHFVLRMSFFFMFMLHSRFQTSTIKWILYQLPSDHLSLNIT